MAEHLAFGTLLKEGYPVRLSGQDSERGTFSQRHSVLIDQETERRYTPLKYVSPDQGRFEVINSMLSEEAVLAFEYGYTLAEPNALVMWEAQFGDFANGAQVVFDQFISSGERKWLRMSGLVCLLPHGYEGQGPEHSSARLERFLQLCAEDNWQVANCTTPANYFHILRRQLHRKFRKPLILMTPKSLLRHKRVVSDLAEMGPGTTFHRVLWDDAQSRQGEKIKLKPDSEIRRVVLCSGKVYYDLYEAREAAGIDDVYLMRVEQLYPFPAKALVSELSRFPKAEIVWAQEEPRNMGAWSFVEPNIEWVLQHTPIANTRRALRRPAGVGCDGDGPRQQAQSGAEDAGRSRRSAPLSLDCDRDMTIEIKVPALGESVTEATVGQWFKKPGEAVEGRRAAGRAGDRQGDGGSAGAGRRRAGRHQGRRRAQPSASARCWAPSRRAQRRPRAGRSRAEGASRAGAEASRARPRPSRAPPAGNGGMPPAPAARKMMEEKGARRRRRAGLRPARPGAQGGRGRRRRQAAAAPAAAAGRGGASTPMATAPVPVDADARARPSPTMPRARSACA